MEDKGAIPIKCRLSFRIGEGEKTREFYAEAQTLLPPERLLPYLVEDMLKTLLYEEGLRLAKEQPPDAQDQ